MVIEKAGRGKECRDEYEVENGLHESRRWP